MRTAAKEMVFRAKSEYETASKMEFIVKSSESFEWF
jgi:hypothetical protein